MLTTTEPESIRSTRARSHSVVRVAAVVLAFASVRSAVAHPHVFVDVRMKFMLSDTALDGFYVYWDFDPLNSAGILVDYDRNGDKRIDSAEARVIQNEGLNTEAENNFFISCTYGLTMLEVRAVERFRVSVVQKNLVSFSFYVPCGIGIAALEGRPLNICFEDPSMYIAFSLRKNLIQASTADRVIATVGFTKRDYTDVAVLTVKQAPQ